MPLELSADDLDRVVSRTDGTTASFLKELLRRAVLESLAEATPLRDVRAAHVDAALDDLLDSTQNITAALLGLGTSEGTPAESRGGRAAGSHGGFGPQTMTSYLQG